MYNIYMLYKVFSCTLRLFFVWVWYWTSFIPY